MKRLKTATLILALLCPALVSRADDACPYVEEDLRDELGVATEDVRLALPDPTPDVDSVVVVDSVAEGAPTVVPFDDGFVIDVNALNASEKALLKKERSFDYMCATSILSGGIQTWVDVKTKRYPTIYPERDKSILDYGVAASPLAAAWLMKAFGVKSRSSLRRMGVASTLSIGLSALATEGFKRGVSELRPDASDRRSFSSGHAAIAFASATILSREYGHVSPWVSVGGYAAAAVTEGLRTRHNAHWTNDLLSGAAVGIVCTNLAYFITDRIFSARDIRRVGWHDYERRMKETMRHQSGVTLYCGTEMGGKWIYSHQVTNHTSLTDYRIKPLTCISTGVDASWFMTENFGLEVMGRYNDIMAKVNPADVTNTYQGAHIYQYHLNVAAKYSVPFSIPFLPFPPMRFSARVLTGLRSTGEATISIMQGGQPQPFATIPGANDWELGGGCDFTFISGPHYAGGFAFDYYRTFAHLLPNRYSIGSTWKVLF